MRLVQGSPLDAPAREGGRLFRNELVTSDKGVLRFTDVTDKAGVGLKAVGMGAAAADYDNDGDLDLLVTNNGGKAELLRNEGNSGNGSVLLRLVGSQSNRSAVGARVRVTAGGVTQGREVKAGSSYLGQNDLRQHIGEEQDDLRVGHHRLAQDEDQSREQQDDREGEGI